MDESFVCPNCGHAGEQYEFEEHVLDSMAPDLVGTFICPSCDHAFGDGDPSYSWRG